MTITDRMDFGEIDSQQGTDHSGPDSIGGQREDAAEATPTDDVSTDFDFIASDDFIFF